VLRTPTPSHRLSFQYHIRSLTFPVPSFNYRNTPILSEKVCVVFCCRRSSVFILSVLRTSAKKREKQKNSLLLHPLLLTCCPFNFTCCQQRLFLV
jgi:hypothetical protein